VRLGRFGGKRAFQDLFHQQDSATGRIHFLAQLAIRWTGGQTKAAMNTRLHRAGHWLAERTKLFRGYRMQH
jgi:hypothetical protein